MSHKPPGGKTHCLGAARARKIFIARRQSSRCAIVTELMSIVTIRAALIVFGAMSNTALALFDISLCYNHLLRSLRSR